MTTPSEDDITFMMKKCGIDPADTEQRKSIWENMFGVISRTEQWPDEREFKEKPLMLKRLMQETDSREIQGRTKSLPKQLSVEAAVRKSMGERRKWSADGKVFMEATGCLKVYSKKELKVLKRIAIHDLELYKTHLDRYLLCKTLAGATGLLEATLPVVDPAGNTLQLKLFSYPLVPITLGAPSLDDYDAVFPKGTVLAIKEPRITLYSDYQDEACIRVDCPNDIVILDPKSFRDLIGDENIGKGFSPISTLEKEFEAWKDEGNGFYKERRYVRAEATFTAAIDQHLHHPKVHVLYLNRCAANLVLERWDRAESDAQAALNHLERLGVPEGADKKDHEKYMIWALIRHGKARYGRRDWKGAKEAFEMAVAKLPGCADAKTSLGKTMDRLKEAQYGCYDFLSIFKHGLAVANPRHDVADYIGPVKEVGISGMGKGLVSTRDIAVGELVVANKAFGLVYKADTPRTRIWTANMKVPEAFVGETAATALARASLKYQAFYQEEAGDRLKELYAGTYTTKKRKGYPVTYQGGKSGHPKPIDPAMIDRILMYNSFQPHIVDYSEPPIKDMNYAVRRKFVELDQSAVAVYGMSSLFNHSCVSNCTYLDYGGFHVIRAVEHIPEGTQLMLNYVGEAGYEDRQARLTGLMEEGFECECRRCKEDRKDGPKKREMRQAILEQAFTKSANKGHQNTQDNAKYIADIRAGQRHAELLLPVLEQSYKGSDNIMKTELALLYRHIGTCSQLIDTFDMNKTDGLKAARYLELYLRHTGVIMAGDPVTGPRVDALKKSAIRSLPTMCTEDAIVTMFGLASIYGYTLKDSFRAGLWEQAGVETHRLAYAPSFEFSCERNKFISGTTEQGLVRFKSMDKESSLRGCFD